MSAETRAPESRTSVDAASSGRATAVMAVVSETMTEMRE